MEAYRLLLKSYWSSQDIADYYDLGLSSAKKIKNDVEMLYGTPSYFIDKERVCVKADDVIRFMGGTSRLDEMQLIALANKIHQEVNE